jgi:hypothetical protein
MHIDYWYWNQRGSHYITVFLTCDIPFIFYGDIAIDRELPTSTSNSVIAAANTDVEMANDVEIQTLRSTIDAPLVSTRSRRSENVDESTTGWASKLTQISLNTVTDYKWIIFILLVELLLSLKINLKSFVGFENTVRLKLAITFFLD